MVWEIIQGLLLIFVMIFASGVAVDAFEKLAHRIKVNKLMLATIIVGFSTSIPEFAVGLASVWKGQPQIALGNIVGANLANLGLIAGGATIIVGSVPVVGEYLKRDLWETIAMATLPMLLMIDGTLSRLDGVVLLAMYLIYVNNMVKRGNVSLKHMKLAGRKVVKHRKSTWWHEIIDASKIVGSILIISFAASRLISIVTSLSVGLNVSLFWIGMVVIALGTTLPELVLSFMASEKGEMSLLLGNVLGSVVVNSTFILGMLALFGPIEYDGTAQKSVAGLFLVVTLGLFWLFTHTKHKLERWEGVVLVGIYLMFMGLQFILS